MCNMVDWSVKRGSLITISIYKDFDVWHDFVSRCTMIGTDTTLSWIQYISYDVCPNPSDYIDVANGFISLGLTFNPLYVAASYGDAQSATQFGGLCVCELTEASPPILLYPLQGAVVWNYYGIKHNQILYGTVGQWGQNITDGFNELSPPCAA